MLAAGALEGRVALVTGGGTGLGRAMALELSRLGASVAVLGRRREPLEETVAAMGRGVAVPADVRDADAIAGAFDAAEAELGPLTTVVNNAAGNFLVHAEELSPNGWRAVVGIVLEKHVPESVANNFTIVLIDAGIHLFLNKFFKFFAERYIHSVKNTAMSSNIN